MLHVESYEIEERSAFSIGNEKNTLSQAGEFFRSRRSHDTKNRCETFLGCSIHFSAVIHLLEHKRQIMFVAPSKLGQKDNIKRFYP